MPAASSMLRGSIHSGKSPVNVTSVFSQSNMNNPVMEKGITSFEPPGVYNGGFPTYKHSGLGNLGAPITTFKILLVDDDDMI